MTPLYEAMVKWITESKAKFIVFRKREGLWRAYDHLCRLCFVDELESSADEVIQNLKKDLLANKILSRVEIRKY